MLTRVGRFLFLAASVCACSIAFAEELTVTNPVLTNLRPWCIGRFVFDRPAASIITNEVYEFQGDKLETQYNVAPATYQATVAELEKKLKTKKRIDPGSGNEPLSHVWLEKSFSPTGESRVFI